MRDAKSAAKRQDPVLARSHRITFFHASRSRRRCSRGSCPKAYPSFPKPGDRQPPTRRLDEAGDREFIIDEGDDDTVRFTHVEDVHGVLFPVFHALMGSAIRRSHDAFNTSLRHRAEELAGPAATPL
jgi:hypothetical protein